VVPENVEVVAVVQSVLGHSARVARVWRRIGSRIEQKLGAIRGAGQTGEQDDGALTPRNSLRAMDTAEKIREILRELRDAEQRVEALRRELRRLVAAGLEGGSAESPWLSSSRDDVPRGPAPTASLEGGAE
jgi:predicted RNase H-like nuclease (RuvC/YqgF family)